MLLTSVLIVGMIGMLALSIDLGFLFSARNQFQNGIDAATLAAGTALRVTIESDSSAPQQTLIAQELAVQFAGYNQVRRYADPDPDSGEPNANNIVLASGNVVVDRSADIPKVGINTSMTMPLLFAGLFGFSSMDMGAAATASLLPVDGGIGTIGSGTATGAGCWRPLLLPDTFYDTSDQPIIVG
ncbi:MAG: pilus assembly protein TadG-related protein, partial [Blastocatellia bacterium]